MNKIYRILISCVVIAVSLHTAAAQSIPISGKVTDESGVAMPGVNIIERGTTNGTTSDADGKYSLSVSQGNAVLVLSFIGYTNVTVEVANRTTIDVSLISDVKSLEEVVVVGYGTQHKKEITGAVSQISA